jgi:hypothetical protein
MARRHRNRKHRRPPVEPVLPDDSGLDTWFYYGNQRMWVVGFTEGGAPYGAVEDLDDPWIFDSDDLESPQAFTDAEPF